MRRGEVVTLLGPNGAGKTTTIEILEGFRRRSGGQVAVLGEDPARAGEDWRAKVGVVLQSWRDHPRWTPRGLLTHLGSYYSPYSRPDRPRPRDVDELLELVGLLAEADQRIVTLSGGKRRRLDVAIGIVGRPELLFLDEPTAGFDPHARREFHDLIHRLTDFEDTTVLLTTHDLSEAEKLADRILILAAGRIVADGTAGRLRLRRRCKPMTGTAHAVAVGLRRGSTEFIQSLCSPQDQLFYLAWGIGAVGYLYVNRNNEVEGISLSFPALALPSMLAAILAFSIIVGPAYALAMEREDGTLLRAKASPRGMTGYVTGQLLLHALSLVPMLLIILVPSMLLFDGVMQRGAAGWLLLLGMIVVGLAAMLPIGMVIGALTPSVQKVGTWGLAPVLGVAGIPGIFMPLTQMWGWVQGIAQVFPVYWMGLGLRRAFLPEEAAAIEVGGTFRPVETVLVLLVWAVVGALVAPVVLRRMARRQSGSAVQAARETANQWVR